MKPEHLLPKVLEIARQVGDEILSIYQQGQFDQTLKADLTPVTSADLKAHQILMQKLAELTPDLPILSEEGVDIPLETRKSWSRYWLVDPLDGTQEFISGTGEFTTVIALVDNHQPVLGVVYYPVKQTFYYAVKSQGAFKQVVDGKEVRLPVSQCTLQNNTISVAISSRQKQSNTQHQFVQGWQCHFMVLGSASLKACLVAEGGADCYLRLGPTGEWDTAAVQCIVEEAGGFIWDINWQPLSYNCNVSLENPNFVVVADRTLPWQTILK